MKILALDIETRPNLVYTWGLRNQDIAPSQVEQPASVLCFAAKWIGKRGVLFHSVWKDGRRGMLEAAHSLLDEADVLMHYNGNSFDIPHLNREFAMAGLTPPSPSAQIDLLTAVRRRFRFASSKLEHVSVELGLGGKVKHEGFGLWKGVMEGDELAQRRMERYNKRDVTLLEEMYEILKPWIPNHPSVPLRDGISRLRPACPVCGGEHVQRRGTAYTKVSAFPQFQCQTCGKWFRGTRRTASTDTTEIAA